MSSHMMTYRSDDEIPAESHKLPTWLNAGACQARKHELDILASEIRLLWFFRPMIDYEVLIAKFYDIQARVNRFGAVMYPGKRHRTWRMLMEQHDAVFLEVPKKSLKRDLDVIQEIMSNPDTEGWCDVKLRVPITAEAKYGPNLGELIREETVIPEEE